MAIDWRKRRNRFGLPALQTLHLDHPLNGDLHTLCLIDLGKFRRTARTVSLIEHVTCDDCLRLIEHYGITQRTDRDGVHTDVPEKLSDALESTLPSEPSSSTTGRAIAVEPLSEPLRASLDEAYDAGGATTGRTIAVDSDTELRAARETVVKVSDSLGIERKPEEGDIAFAKRVKEHLDMALAELYSDTMRRTGITPPAVAEALTHLTEKPHTEHSVKHLAEDPTTGTIYTTKPPTPSEPLKTKCTRCGAWLRWCECTTKEDTPEHAHTKPRTKPHGMGDASTHTDKEDKPPRCTVCGDERAWCRCIAGTLV